MKKYKNISTKKLAITFTGLLTLGSVLGWFEHGDLSAILDAWLFSVPYFSTFLLIDYFFTYLKIDETKRQVIALSFLFSQNRVKIDSITRITKEPHPIFKGASWAIFIHYIDDAGKKKHFEIWPSFSPKTIGKFLADIKKLNPSIQFDQASEDWMKKAKQIES